MVELKANITLKVGDKELTVTEDEARELYNKLKGFFEYDTITYPSIPYTPPATPFPGQPWTVTYCNS